MTNLRTILSESTSDVSEQVKEITTLIFENPGLIDELVPLLEADEKKIRLQVAKTLESIAREKPGLLLPYFHILLTSAQKDPLPSVKEHLAMLFGHLSIFAEYVVPIFAALVNLLESESETVRNSAVISMTIIAKIYPEYQPKAIGEISGLEQADEKSLRLIADKALKILIEGEPFSESWVKSPMVQAKISESF